MAIKEEDYPIFDDLLVDGNWNSGQIDLILESSEAREQNPDLWHALKGCERFESWPIGEPPDSASVCVMIADGKRMANYIRKILANAKRTVDIKNL